MSCYSITIVAYHPAPVARTAELTYHEVLNKWIGMRKSGAKPVEKPCVCLMTTSTLSDIKHDLRKVGCRDCGAITPDALPEETL